MLAKVPAQVLRGWCMGTADIVPGVSGGTIALVLGIYDELVAAVHGGARALGRFVRLDLRGGLAGLAAIDWLFLLPLLAGIGMAIVVLSHTIERLLDEWPVELAAAFFGFVLAAAILTWQQLLQRDRIRLLALTASGTITFIALGWRGAPASDPALWFVLMTGAVAVCAMILPGISGSLFLLMLGTYDHVLGAVNERDVIVLGVFTAGAVAGLALFSSLLEWLLRHHRETVMAALVGLMAGSLRVLWPWPDGTASPTLAWPEPSEVAVPLLLAATGAVAVLALVRLSAARVRHARTGTASRGQPGGQI